MIRVKIITSKKILIYLNCVKISLSGERGKLVFTKNHENFITLLRHGIIIITTNNNKSIKLFIVSEGICKFFKKEDFYIITTEKIVCY